MLIRGARITLDEFARFIRISALMTAGTLTAPFGQAHELFHSRADLLRLLTSLVHSKRLNLSSQFPDLSTFLESRRDFYSENRSHFSNYFKKEKQKILSDAYKVSPDLGTTRHIKRELSILATVGTVGNTFSAEEVNFAKSQRDFVTGTLIDRPMGATYGVYLKQDIHPQPMVSQRLGNLSSRVFSAHYQEVHAAVSPTGVYADHLVENYDHFPFYDIEINFTLLSQLGLSDVVVRPEFERIFNTLASDQNLFRFVEMKDHLFQSITNKLKIVDRVLAPTSDNLKSELRKFPFQSTGAGGLVPDPTLFAEKIRNAIAGRASRDSAFAGTLSQETLIKVNRVRIAIFTATNLEDAVLQAQLAQHNFLPAGKLVGPEGTYNVYSMYDRVHVVHVRTGMGSSGMHGSQRVAHDFLSSFEIEMAISVGICFGVDRKTQQLADVIIAEQFTLYEPAKIKDGIMQFRGDRIPAEARLVSYGHASAADFERLGHKVFVGPILTGEKLVDDELFRNTILAANGKAVGGEMETGGLVTSCYARQVRFGMAKGICDFADKKSDDVQEAAAGNAIRLVLGFIQHRWGDSN